MLNYDTLGGLAEDASNDFVWDTLEDDEYQYFVMKASSKKNPDIFSFDEAMSDQEHCEK